MTLIYLACAWLLGLYLGSLFCLPAWVLGMAALVGVAVAFACREHAHARRVGFCLLVLSFGLWRYDLARPTLVPGPLAGYNDGGKVTFHGLVVNDPVPRDRWANLQVSVYELKADEAWVPMRGQVLVQVPSYQAYHYGDDLEISGNLQTPSELESFSYGMYLARQGIHSLLRYPRIMLLAQGKGQPLLAFLYGLKRRTQSVITAIVPEPEAALLNGILLGSDEGIPSSLMDKFRTTGTAHIIAISGFNITVISAALVKVFSRFLQRYLALIVAVVAIALYAVLVGAEPPVVRAAIMGSLSAFALIVGRQSDALTSLFAAAWLMTAWQPFALWDLDFQLSFAASLGLIMYVERLQRWFEGLLSKCISAEATKRVGKLLNNSLLVTLAAQITTLPLLVYYFGQFSLLSLAANLLILPVQPAIMYLGSTAAMAGLALLPLGQLLGWVAWLFLTYTIRIVELTARWVSIFGAWGNVHPIIPLACYILLALFTVDSIRLHISPRAIWHKLQKGTVYKAVIAALVVSLILVWVAVASLPDGRLRVTFLDVGQGDAILVQMPAGQRLLIDGGPNPAALLTALGRRLPFWDRHIDVVILSHPHDDHLRGLFPVLERYYIGQVIMGDAGPPSDTVGQWLELVREQSIPLLTAEHPLQISFDDGLTMQIYLSEVAADSETSQTWLVAHLNWQNVSFLFTGDLEADSLLELADAGWPLACTVLKVPHHGSAEGLNEELLTAIHPDLAVISVGADNRFGHPASSTLQLLAQQGVIAYRTDQAGDVEVVVNANGMWKVKTKQSNLLSIGSFPFLLD